MNKRVLVHGGWATAALVAFGVGKLLSSQSGTAPDNTRSTAAGAPTVDSVPSSGTSISALTKSGSETAGDLIGGNSKPLTERRILELGDIVRTHGSPLERRLAFAKLLEGVTAENAMMIRGQLMGLRHDSQEWRDFHYAWGAVAGAEAVAHGMESPEHDMAVTLSGWADTDPTAALAWFDQLPPEDRAGNSELKYGLASGLANHNPDAAAAFAFDLARAGDDQADRVLTSVAMTVARNDGIQQAATWTETLQAGAMRAAAMDRVAHEYVEFDPTAATIWAGQFNNDPHSARVIEEVADEVARDDPEHAINWLASLDPSPGRTMGYRSSFRRLARRSTNDAGQAAAAIPTSAERDAALTGVAITAGSQHEAAAFDFIGQISSWESRVGAVEVAAPQFARSQSAEQALSWVQVSLPETGHSSAAAVEWINSRWGAGSSTPQAALRMRNDAPAAAAWLETLPAAEGAALRNQAIRSVNEGRSPSTSRGRE